MMVFYFTGLSVAAVGSTAEEVVQEVRRQFKENPDIMENRASPDYNKCVSLVRNVPCYGIVTPVTLGALSSIPQVTAAALREMRFPGLLAVGMPVLVGIVFRVIGEATSRPMLGAEVGSVMEQVNGVHYIFWAYAGVGWLFDVCHCGWHSHGSVP